MEGALAGRRSEVDPHAQNHALEAEPRGRQAYRLAQHQELAEHFEHWQHGQHHEHRQRRFFLCIGSAGAILRIGGKEDKADEP